MKERSQNKWDKAPAWSISKQTAGYILVLIACFTLATVAGWTAIANQIDNYAYDWMFRLMPATAQKQESIVLAIDDATYTALGGVRSYRTMLAQALELLSPARPKVVAIDVILTDPPLGDARDDDRLEAAMTQTRNLVLATDLSKGRWENPLPRFAKWAAAIGHDTSDENSPDGVTRAIPLEKRTGSERHWALALEAFRLKRGMRILESPADLQVGEEIIPAARTVGDNRPLRVLYAEGTPQVSLKALIDQPDLLSKFSGKVVFVGVTSLSATKDRVKTPIGEMSGVEVHAQLFDTLSRGRFLTNPSNLSVLAICVAIALLAGVVFRRFAGWQAYLVGALLLLMVHTGPFFLFQYGTVVPYFAPLATAWLTVSGAASYQHFVVRRQLRQSETARSRYLEAIHMVTHEMRTPLTAIQGSSELMGRYNLSEEKRKQIALMINSESKRLARMIQTFLDVERLSAGEVELKQEPFTVSDVIGACLDRVRPLAERKNIRIRTEPKLPGDLNGDRELMEYAVYNLMTNAVKYSPPDTEIAIASHLDGGHLRLSVKDQGIGMDARELKNIFQKFYRTRRAEASGEKGTGIGLSIVEQIVHHHGGKMEVTSEVGKGSCFTMVLPTHSRAPQSPAVSV